MENVLSINVLLMITRCFPTRSKIILINAITQKLDCKMYLRVFDKDYQPTYVIIDLISRSLYTEKD